MAKVKIDLNEMDYDEMKELFNELVEYDNELLEEVNSEDLYFGRCESTNEEFIKDLVDRDSDFLDFIKYEFDLVSVDEVEESEKKVEDEETHFKVGDIITGKKGDDRYNFTTEKATMKVVKIDRDDYTNIKVEILTSENYEESVGNEFSVDSEHFELVSDEIDNLNEGDYVTIKGMKLELYKIRNYFLHNDYGDNSKVFDDLSINNKKDFVEKIVGYEPLGGDFPEVKSIEDLRKVIRALKEVEQGVVKDVEEKSVEFKVGDKVRIISSPYIGEIPDVVYTIGGKTPSCGRGDWVVEVEMNYGKDDLFFEESELELVKEEENSPELKLYQRVNHEEHGNGTIIKIEDDLILIRFDKQSEDLHSADSEIELTGDLEERCWFVESTEITRI